VEGKDYVIVENLISPNPGTSKARVRTAIDYYATIIMAKELAMVENNDRGRPCT
jgi:anti-repressor protein